MSGSIPKSAAIGTIPVEATRFIDTGHEVLLHDNEQRLAIARFHFYIARLPDCLLPLMSGSILPSAGIGTIPFEATKKCSEHLKNKGFTIF